MQYRFLSIILGLILMTVIITGCNNNKYSEFTKKFNESFLKVANAIDCKSNRDSLERIKLDENKNEISKMKTLLENIKNDVPKGMEDHYKYLSSLYEDLLFLQEASSKIDNLSEEEASHVFGNIVIIESERDELEGKN